MRVCLSLASQTSWRVEWSPAEKLRVCWSASLALTVPRPPSSCRAPMLTHTTLTSPDSEFRVSRSLRFSKARTTERVWLSCVIQYVELTGGTPVRCFVIYLIIRPAAGRFFLPAVPARFLPGSCPVPAQRPVPSCKFLPARGPVPARFLAGSCPVPARFLPGSCPVPARFLPDSRAASASVHGRLLRRSRAATGRTTLGCCTTLVRMVAS